MTERVLVTGSSRGIGRAIALRLAQDGFDIVLHCRNGLAQAEEVHSEVVAMGRECQILQFDVADRAEARRQLENDIEKHGAYYGVVVNAGVSSDGAFPALSEDDWDRVIHTNLDGFYNIVHPVCMPMIRRRKPGRIVTMASVSGIIGNRGQVNYSASKAGIIGATKALAVELAKRNITVNCVAPGMIGTEMIEDVALDEALKFIPANRVGTVDEVASAVSFLISSESSYITRQVLSVNGGIC